MEKDNALTCSTVFPDRLSDLINEKQKLGISQNVIAEKLEVSKSVLSEWASGKKKPSLKNLCNLSQYFGVSTDYLLGLTDARAVEPDIRAIQEYTGLNDSSLKRLKSISKDRRNIDGSFLEFINFLFDNYYFDAIVSALFDYQSAIEASCVRIELSREAYDEITSDIDETSLNSEELENLDDLIDANFNDKLSKLIESKRLRNNVKKQMLAKNVLNILPPDATDKLYEYFDLASVTPKSIYRHHATDLFFSLLEFFEAKERAVVTKCATSNNK